MALGRGVGAGRGERTVTAHRCNAYCDPRSGTHCTFGYTSVSKPGEGDWPDVVGRTVWIENCPQAVVLAVERALEAPPATWDPSADAWLTFWRPA